MRREPIEDRLELDGGSGYDELDSLLAVPKDKIVHSGANLARVGIGPQGDS
jgi:hypothetical protein